MFGVIFFMKGNKKKTESVFPETPKDGGIDEIR